MSRPIPPRTDILRALRGQRKWVHLSEVAVELGVPSSSRRRLGEFLEQLVTEGVLEGQSGKRYRAAGRTTKTEGWDGVLSVNPRGFGFVNCAGRDDVFLPPPALGGALHGDTVRIVIAGRSARGLEGRVEKIVKRRAERVCGVLRRKGRACWLEPDDARIRGPIVLNAKATRNEEDGAAAVVQITRFPEFPDENPEGELLEVLGRPGDAQVEVAKILARDGITEERNPEALEQAKQRAAELWPLSMEGRKDLRSLPLLTIDPADARDHDDALYVERRTNGYRAHIAIADVSEYVQPGTAVDEEAQARCFTTYLPDRAVPMLPPILAADQCSLLPHQDRFCLCAIVDLDREGVVTRFRLVEAVVHVAGKLSYEEVAATLGMVKRAEKSADAERFKRDLRVLNELARKLRRARMQRGALDLDLPEPRIELDKGTGRPLAITRRTKDPGISGAYQMVEEMMLLANERVARWLGRRRSPGVFRIHAPPDSERLDQLGKAAKLLDLAFDKDMLSDPVGVSKWLRRISKHPLKLVLEGLLLRSLKQAQYDIDNIGHFGLASEAYVHFTSPIRRYPDLLVHRLSKALLRGGKPVTSSDALDELRAQATRSGEVERVVLHAEREVVDVYRCLLMQDRVGEIFEGRVTGIAGGGLYVVLDEPFVDVMVRFESLGSDRYEVSDDGLRVEGQRSGDRVALGDRMTLEIEDVALLRRSIYGRRLAMADSAFERESVSGSPQKIAVRRGSSGQSEDRRPAGPGRLDSRGSGRGPARPETRRASGRTERRGSGRGRPAKRG